jgi:hypothetical protein
MLLIWLFEWWSQRGFGIRVPDRTPVGCCRRLEKKNGHRQFFCPLRPIWALIIMRVQLYTTWYSKAHRKREWRVKYITNITPNWSPAFTFMCLLPDKGERGTRQPKNRPRVFDRLSHSNCGNQHITCVWSWTIQDNPHPRQWHHQPKLSDFSVVVQGSGA